MNTGTITMPDGRTVGFADYGTSDQISVLWCHGGPGCRFEPGYFAADAARAGLRLVGIDRPGYGQSTPWSGRTIGGWVPDALAVADHLGIEKFVAVGCSTGGAYALALASRSDRVLGAVACCAVTDMGWAPGKAMNVSSQPVWSAPDREAGLAIAVTLLGEDGSKAPADGDGFVGADKALFTNPEYLRYWSGMIPEMFAHGVAGYTDDRLADGPGWHDFDVADITCPVAVIHGGDDMFLPVANAQHTAAIVPGATLRIFDELGHLGVVSEVVGTVRQMLNGNLS